jgi:hypothetical protein
MFSALEPEISMRSRRQVLFVLATLAGLILPTSALANDNPPEILPLADLQRDPGALILFPVNTDDLDGDAVSLAGANVPTGATFSLDGNGNGSFYWVPKDADEGLYVVTFIATDNGVPMLSTSVDVTITVGDPNLTPTLDPVGDQVATVGMLLVVPLSATDPEGDPLTFSTDPILDGSAIRIAASGSVSYEYTPFPAAVGNQALTIIVSDGRTSDEEMIVISVGDVNVPPILAAIGNRVVDVGSELDIALHATDADLDGLSFSTSPLPAGAVLTDHSDGTGRITWVPTEAGVLEMTVTVTDDGTPNESAAETFEVEVLAPPVEEDFAVDQADWTDGSLVVSGGGALPGGVVEFFDPTTGANLGSTVADENGDFSVELFPFVPPCSVEARSERLMSEPILVAGAPTGCSESPPTSLRMAYWSCRTNTLQVLGHRAPPQGIVRVYDMQSEALLGQTRAGRRGHFLLRMNSEEAPMGVTASVEVGGVEWMLDPVQVWKKSRCSRRGHDGGSEWGRGHKHGHDHEHERGHRGSHEGCRQGRH